MMEGILISLEEAKILQKPAYRPAAKIKTSDQGVFTF
jgi:hypothetical protein